VASKPTNELTLSYRQAQKFVTWCRENVARAKEVPGKNSGWGSVRLLMVGITGTLQYAALFKGNNKLTNELAAHLGVPANDLHTMIANTATLAN
jgi:hypothetical protein